MPQNMLNKDVFMLKRRIKNSTPKRVIKGEEIKLSVCDNNCKLSFKKKSKKKRFRRERNFES